MTDQQLLEKREAAVNEGTRILETAEREGRALTGEEQEKWDRLHEEATSLKGTLDRREKQRLEQRDLETSRGRFTQPTDPDDPGSDGEARHLTNGNGHGWRQRRTMAEQGEADRREALRAWCMAKTHRSLTQRQREVAEHCGLDLGWDMLTLRFADKAPTSRADLAGLEVRAQATTPGTGGGYTVPTGFVRELEAAMLAFGGMREVARVIRTDGDGALPIPTANDTNQKGVILAENTQVAEQDIVFGQITLDSYKYSSKMIRVSIELLQDSAIDISAFIGQALGERIARATNEHFTVGTGTGQPRGAVTAATLGKTGAAAQLTSVIYDDFVDLMHSVDPAYRQGARYMLHDSTLKAAKKLKDTTGRPIWAAGMAVGEPDTILGAPYTINQDMPQMGASAKSVLYGNFSSYWIRDVAPFTLLRLDERFADYHQIAFLAFSRHDGDLIDAGVSPVRYFAHAAA
jgi:HK97 family phage major capsid protein